MTRSLLTRGIGSRRGSLQRRRRTRFDTSPTPATAQLSTVRSWTPSDPRHDEVTRRGQLRLLLGAIAIIRIDPRHDRACTVQTREPDCVRRRPRTCVLRMGTRRAMIATDYLVP
jgi:hypothetical protein